LTSHQILRRSQSRVMDYVYRAIGGLPLPRKIGLLHRLGGVVVRDERYFERSFHGLRYHGAHHQYIDRHVWLFGEYCATELRFLEFAAGIAKRERNAVTFLDVGANVGHHSLFMAGHADTVLAFEPSSACRSQFSDNITANGINNIEILPYALGEADYSAKLGSGLPGNTGAQSLMWTLDGQAWVDVEVRHGQRLLDARNFPRIDVMKIDVEGYERRVLEGMQSRLCRDRPVLLFELWPPSHEAGFTSEEQLKRHLYPDCMLYNLPGYGAGSVLPFTLGHNEVVCIPHELLGAFRPLLPDKR
jgi:FkbM family methyltransferase